MKHKLYILFSCLQNALNNPVALRFLTRVADQWNCLGLLPTMETLLSPDTLWNISLADVSIEYIYMHRFMIYIYYIYM